MRYSDETMYDDAIEEQERFVLRKENEEWLAFSPSTHTVTRLGRVSLEDIELPGEIVRTHDHDAINGAMTAPLKLFVSVSNMCNLECVHCMSSSSPSGETRLSVDDLKQISDEAAEMGVFQVTIGGGEPLIYNGIWNAIAYMRERDLGVSITTNAYLLRDSDIDNLKKFNVKTNVSIDGSRDNHDRIRSRQGSYDRTVKNITRLTNRGISPTLRFTMMNSNLSDVDHMIQLSEELGVELKPRRAKPAGRVLEGSEIITESSQAYMDAVIKLNNAGCGMEDMMSFNPSPREDLVMRDTDCGAGTRLAFIDEDGSISPCTYLGKDFVSSKWKPGRLKEAWSEAPEFIKMRNLKPNSDCSSCSRHSSCHTECPAMRLHVGGSLDAQDPGCIKPTIQFLASTIKVRQQ